MGGEIRYGMVGGSMRAFIGEVHRKAIGFDTRAELVCGCFSSNKELNRETALAYSISDDRTYADYAEMAEKESKRPDAIDFAVIVTPNHLHYEAAKAFLLKGINVVCEKPLCLEVWQAEELLALSNEKGLLFCVTYAYAGYTMPKVLKEMVKNGKIGEIISVNAEYVQDWLLDTLHDDNSVHSIWRQNPEVSGISNCVGDIGTHVENMVHFVTGLRIKRVAATVNRFGKALDLNANILVEYENGVNGAYWCTQIAAGKLNGLYVRIYGTEGSVEWEQHHPDYARYSPRGCAPQTISRGMSSITETAAGYGRLPAGHPEGYYIAFANLYRSYIDALIKKKNGETLTEADIDFPNVSDGLNGIKFVHAVIKSGDNDSMWVEV